MSVQKRKKMTLLDLQMGYFVIETYHLTHIYCRKNMTLWDPQKRYFATETYRLKHMFYTKNKTLCDPLNGTFCDTNLPLKTQVCIILLCNPTYFLWQRIWHWIMYPTDIAYTHAHTLTLYNRMFYFLHDLHCCKYYPKCMAITILMGKRADGIWNLITATSWGRTCGQYTIQHREALVLIWGTPTPKPRYNRCFSFYVPSS